MTLRHLAVTIDEATRMAFASVYALLVIAALFGLFVWALREASAHDSWISKGTYRNPAGEWCCGAGDCGVMVGGRISAIAGGYEVDADFAIEQERGAPVVDHVKEVVPYSEAMPSPDGAYWRCKRPDGSRRCFFVGPPGS